MSTNGIIVTKNVTLYHYAYILVSNTHSKVSEHSMPQAIPKEKRIISGILAASMILSLFTGFGGSVVAAEASQPGEEDKRGAGKAVSQWGKGDGQIAMPLMLDQSMIGFTGENDTTEVTAYMTDIWYLNTNDNLVISLEEYAAFFPASLDLEEVSYLSRDMRKALESTLAAMDEEKRLSLRAGAEVKLDMKNQFIWEAALEGSDYSDKLEIEPVRWTIYEASRNNAPMIACEAEVRWIGEQPAPRTSTSNGAFSGDATGITDQLINNGNAAENNPGSKDITQESPEVQEFLWEMYKEGGLVQEKSDYDLTPFEERAKAEGLIIGTSDSTDVELDQMLDQLQQEGETTPADSDFNLLDGLDGENGKEKADTATANGAAPAPEAADHVGEDGDQTILDNAVPKVAVPGDEEEAQESREPAEEVRPEESQAPVEENRPEESQAPVEEDRPEESQVPADEDGDESADMTTDVTAEEDGEDHLHLPNYDEFGDTAYFSVRMRSNESIITYGTALCLAGTAEDQPNLLDEGEAKEDSGLTEDGALTTEQQKAAIAQTFNGQDQGPDVASGRVYHIRTFTKKKTDNGDLVPMTYNLSAVMNRLFLDVGGTALKSIGVLDERIAAYDADSGMLTMKTEGRTMVYASGLNSYGDKVYTTAVLEVRDLYYLSSENENELDVKRAVPMVSAGQYHSLALMGDGTVYGWGGGQTGALGSQNRQNTGTPRPVYIKGANGTYEPLTGIVAVAAGSEFSLALTEEGTVYAWGVNMYGQLGVTEAVGDPSYEPLLVLADSDGKNSTEDGKLCNIVAISAGTTHALALANDGTVYAWGRADNGQLGEGDGVAKVERGSDSETSRGDKPGGKCGSWESGGHLCRFRFLPGADS